MPWVGIQETRCSVGVIEMLFMAEGKLLAIFKLLSRSAEDSTSGHFRRQMKVPCEQVTDWSGCRRTLKTELPINEVFHVFIHCAIWSAVWINQLVNSVLKFAEIGPLHDRVTWYKIANAGKKVTKWDFKNNTTRTSPPGPAFVLKVPSRNLHTSMCDFVPCDRIVQRVYCKRCYSWMVLWIGN